MRTGAILAVVAVSCVGAATLAAQPDYYRHLPYPKGLVPGVGRNQVDQEGGPDATGYRRRVVQWWPRKGQDIVDIPEGAPVRVWTRNKGQRDPEALAGVCRTWATSDPETFQAHLVAFRGVGTSTVDPNSGQILIPAAVLRLEDGRPRAVVNYGPVSQMLSKADHAFIQQAWERSFPTLYAKTSQSDLPMPGRPPGGFGGDAPLELWTAAVPRFNAVEPDKSKTRKYPRWGWRGDALIFETPHFHLIARPKHWGKPENWVRPDEPNAQNAYRKSVMEFVETFWTYVEGAGASMPYWRRPGLNYKYIIHIHRNRAAGGWGHCGIGDCAPHILGHEFFHGQPTGGWDGLFIETMCNSGQHMAFPGELQMFNGNFRYPWRNVNTMGYQSSLWFFVLGDNPNWGYGIQAVAGCLAGAAESTPYHTIARLGQQRGLWNNGVRGFGDFFGEYAARMVTCDFVEQFLIRTKYGMPEMSCVYPVYGHENRYRINNAEAPRPYGFNIVRLTPAEGAKWITADFQGIHDPAQHSDWRACLVAVDAKGRARYSPLWNQGQMQFALQPSDRHLWLTVAATPSALPVTAPPYKRGGIGTYLIGPRAPRFPWEVALTGCRPGVPHRKQGDVVDFGELYGMCDSGNTFLNYSVKQEVPLPLTDTHGKLAQQKLAEMLPRIEAAAKAVKDNIEAGIYRKGWWESKKTMRLGDLARRVKFLQRNAKGHRHPNGGGFVADSARVGPSAYVGPGAMVLDGARVEDHACIKGFAVVHGPKTVISGHAKVADRAWVFGDIRVSGNARILEAATVTTLRRTPRTPSQRFEGQAEITGNAVIKGEPFLHLAYATGQTITGGVVLDLAPDVENRASGTFHHGRFYQQHYRRPPSFAAGQDAGALYANWQFNQPKATLLEDSYVNNNGVLYGGPKFAEDGQRRCIIFNGKDQYAVAPPSVADFGQLTIDTQIQWSGGQDGRLFDFGTGANECFYLAVAGEGGTLTLVARHAGKSHRLAATTGLPAGTWARVRVELTGAAASLYLDGKRIARGDFPFRPRMVYSGDRPEGNFIGCSRSKTDFFRGRVDHFRVYRAVHADFGAVPPPPPALTQMQEWSPADQQRADAWDARRRAVEAQVRAGAGAPLLDEIKRLQQQRSTRQRTAKLAELESRSRQADQALQTLDRKIQDAFRARPQTGRAEEEIKQLREKADAIVRQIRQSDAYGKLAEEIRTREKRRGEMEQALRKSPALSALQAQADAAGQRLREAEERIRNLPELTKALKQSEQEKDGAKKRQLRDQHKRLLEARRLSDPAWQEASIAQQRLRRKHSDAHRAQWNVHPGRIALEREMAQLRRRQSDLTAKPQAAHPEYATVRESLAAKERGLQTARSEFEQQARGKELYTKAVSAREEARAALDEERKRIEEGRRAQRAKLDTQIQALQRKVDQLRAAALQRAGLAGANPYPGQQAERIWEYQRSLKYHTTADWDARTPEELGGRVPEKMKQWLLRVRGY